MNLNINIPDFEQYTSDQQFVNVIEALDRLETQKGGLAVEEIWAMAWQVVDKLKSAQRPDATAIRLQSLINSQLKEQMPNRTSEQIMHSTNCVLFCVNYMLCANDEEPDPNQQVIDNLSRALSKMPDIVELFLAVEQMEDSEEARNNVVTLEKGKLAVVQGVDDLIIAEQKGVLLICKKQEEQRIKQMVADAGTQFEGKFA